MLTELIHLLESREHGLSLSEISRELQAQPSAVLFMIELLVLQGRMIEISPEGECCATCGLQSRCSILSLGAIRYMTNKVSSNARMCHTQIPLAQEH